ncbi:unnamed protein product [Rangifer tarandus platyrhynchus]|uniref:Uncharacterized protein n=1 Tax=Rangifer tarandus platyrhynchus TaxID=3082113 RepID=A0AC59ZNR1_RANTA
MTDKTRDYLLCPKSVPHLKCWSAVKVSPLSQSRGSDKPKWHKAKKTITLGYILQQMDKINRDKAQMLRQSSQLWPPDVEMRSFIPGKGLVGSTLTAWSTRCFCNGYCKTNTIFTFFLKVKILFGLLLVRENKD